MNQSIIDNLEILERYYSNEWKMYRQPKDNFRRLAYSKAIHTIRELKYKITDISQVKKLNGIGKSIFEKIREFLNNGFIKKVEELDILPKDKIIDSFLKIWGVGPVKAAVLYEKGYRSIESVVKDPNILNRQQIIGLKYYEDLQKKIPRVAITAMKKIIRYILDKEFSRGTYMLKVAGSYRRCRDHSNDIDILLSSKTFCLKEIVYVLQKYDIITDILSMQNEKFMGIARYPIKGEPYLRLDIEFLPEEEIPFGLLYFTGSKDFNKEIRLHAKKLGYTLNQHGLKCNKTGKQIIARNEEEIFKILGIEYLEPKDR
jgi:DNA polymerase beta